MTSSLSSSAVRVPSAATGRPLAGRTAVVTGATSGIGAAIAIALGAAGATVAVAGRDRGRGQDVVASIERLSGSGLFVESDLSADPAALREQVRRLTAELGGTPDIVVLNAGVYPVTPTELLPDAELERILAVNIRSTHVLVGALAPAMSQRGSGVIVVIGSWMASVGSPFGALYTASKAAEQQLARCWAAEYGPRGVRVNTVAPGVTATPGNADSAAILAEMTRTTPAGRPVEPSDIAAAVIFLASDDARMIYGTTLAVDGGILGTRLS